MMRLIVGMITGIFISLYFMYIAIPLLSTEHTSLMVSPYIINSTDPTTVTSFSLGQGFYQVMPLIPIFVGVFILISYALKRSPDE